MADDEIDHTHTKAIRIATNIAKAHSGRGGNLTDLFAAYALFVVQEDAVVGMTCLDAVSLWFLSAPASQISRATHRARPRERGDFGSPVG
jgi:hypothetical protein